MKMDQSRKFLNAECTRCAKEVQEKEGLKTIMTVTETDSTHQKNEDKDVSITIEKMLKYLLNAHFDVGP